MSCEKCEPLHGNNGKFGFFEHAENICATIYWDKYFFFFFFFFILIYFNTLGVSSNDSLAIVREFLGSSCMGRSRKIRKGGGGADNVFCVF